MQYDSHDDSLPPSRYRALPAQFIEIDDGIIVQRGCTEVRVVGKGAEEAVLSIWKLAHDAPVTVDEITSRYAEPDRETVRQLADKLIARRILIEAGEGDQPPPAAESSLDVFYWHFGLTEPEATAHLDESKLVIVGVNGISRQIAAALTQANVRNFEVVDYVVTRNQRMFGAEPAPRLDDWPDGCAPPVSYGAWAEERLPEEIGCLIATSDHGVTTALRDWNRFCVEHGIDYLPILLRRMVGQIGPFVVPGDTACYECLRARENSHLADHDDLRSSEAGAPYAQALAGFFPSMGSILGDIAAMELVKVRTGQMPFKVGTLVEVKLLVPSLTSRRVLRVPRCAVCAAAMSRPSISLDRADFIPGPQFYEGDKTPAAAPMSPQERFAVPSSDERGA